jgi:hypothetical protein
VADAPTGDYLTADTAYEVVTGIQSGIRALGQLRALMDELGLDTAKIGTTLDSVQEAQRTVAQVRIKSDPTIRTPFEPVEDDPLPPPDKRPHEQAAMLDRAILNLRQLWPEFDGPTKEAVRKALVRLDSTLHEWRG